jgi:hypothetical protein
LAERKGVVPGDAAADGKTTKKTVEKKTGGEKTAEKS